MRPAGAASHLDLFEQPARFFQILLGYQPEHTIETGIAAYIDWLRRHAQ